MTTCRLVWNEHPAVAKAMSVIAHRAPTGSLSDMEAKLPAILVSYSYISNFLDKRGRALYRNWMLDSGAFTAWNSGGEVDLVEYTDAVLRLKEQDPTLVEAVALDVIAGRGVSRLEAMRKSVENARYMKSRGAEVIPVFHIGDDWEILKEYCREFKKVGLSCCFGEPEEESFRFYDKCFELAWPKKFHSFGWMTLRVLSKYPFHSADSASWCVGPLKFARWERYGALSIRGSNVNIYSQLRYFLALEEKLKIRWERELKQLEDHEKRTNTEVHCTGSAGHSI